MPGRVLIIDDLATNRIILKVKLTAAHHDVSQAGAVADACARLDKLNPDLVLLGHRGGATSIDALRESVAKLQCAAAPGLALPVVVLLDSHAPEDRIAALEAGASDVMSRPVDERTLLARLRSLMRQRLADLDLHHDSLGTHVDGFAEAQGGFELPGKVAIIGPNKAEARKLCARLAPHARHGLHLIGAGEIDWPGQKKSSQVPPRQAPDALIIQLGIDQIDDGPRIVSELRADPDTRGCPVIAHLPEHSRRLAAQLYDLGAGDVVFSTTDPREITLRLHRQMAEKRRLDRLRGRLQDGLQAAVIDPLTGLYNRRYALAYLNKLMEQPGGKDDIFAVMVADLDYFKQVNDRLGHAAGDTVLRRVAEMLKATLRKTDLVARIGGEEFLIIIPGTTPEDARRIANGLCDCISSTPIALPGRSDPARVTISIGLTLAGEAAGTGEEIIDEADRALYRSKAEGRNTVRCAARSAA